MRRGLRLLAYLLIAIVSYYVTVVVAGRVIFSRMEQQAGYTRDDHGYVLRIPDSELGVIETGTDTSGDGKQDTLAVQIGTDPDHLVWFVAHDPDSDEWMDTMSLYVGQDGRYASFDEGRFDEVSTDSYQQVTLGSYTREGVYWIYEDVDFDGDFDVMRFKEDENPVRTLLRVGKEWLEEDDSPGNPPYSVRLADGTTCEAVFDYDRRSFVLPGGPE